MMNKILKDVILAVTISVCITLINVLQGESFSLPHIIIYTILAFIVSIILDLIFDMKKK